MIACLYNTGTTIQWLRPKELGHRLGIHKWGGNTALHIASKWGLQPIAEVLFKNGADIGARNHNGDTPLHLASFSGEKAMKGFLLFHGADLTATNNAGETPYRRTTENSDNFTKLLGKSSVLLADKSAERADLGQTPLLSFDDLSFESSVSGSNTNVIPTSP